MPEPDPAGPQEGDDQGQDPKQDGPKGNEEPSQEDNKLTLEAAQAQLKEVRSEAARRRKSEDALQKRIKEFEDAKLSDEERTAKELSELKTGRTDLERQLRESRVEAAVIAAASAKGVLYPDLIVAKVMQSSDLEFTDDGRPKNVDKILDSLKEPYPDLFKATKPQGNADGGARTKTSTSDPATPQERLSRAYEGASSS